MSNPFQDLSGAGSDTSDPNPFNHLLKTCGYSSSQIEARYATHRTTRASQQHDLLLSPSFTGVTIDPILRQILDDAARPDGEKTGYQDPRNCLVLWARPPQRIRELILECQKKLLKVVPNFFLMPQPNLHLTAMEIAHSLTPADLETLIAAVPAAVVERATNLPRELAHGDTPRIARLYKPMLVYDGSAVAISFLPVGSTAPPAPGAADDPTHFTYHAMRARIHELFTEAGITIASRYVVPSSHLTVARFVTDEDTSVDLPDPSATVRRVNDPRKMKAFVDAVEDVNRWLAEEYGGDKGMWTVGEEKGLEMRRGRLWYGDGESVMVGKGI